jgi:2'-5' RNA ligase
VSRAFVAVVPPDAVLDAVAAAINTLDVPNARWMPRSQWHLTLQFLGDHADLDAVTRGLDGLRAQPCEVQLGGGGAFPRAARATVLWCGIQKGADDLAELARRVTARTGVAPDDRPFRAHLTIARTKTPTNVRAAVASLDDAFLGRPWAASDVVLFESTLGRDGAQHTEVARYPLTTLR